MRNSTLWAISPVSVALAGGVLVGLVMGLGGCGQKGDLYLPTTTSAVVASAPVADVPANHEQPALTTVQNPNLNQANRAVANSSGQPADPATPNPKPTAHPTTDLLNNLGSRNDY